MRLLLDTHALLWALSTPTRLPSAVVMALRDPAHEIYVSSASVWEISIKVELGKIAADVDEVVQHVREVAFHELPITFLHSIRVRSIPAHHRDPFDRLLIAQALEDGLTIVTRDTAFAAYRVPTMWK